jgi:hypothetical protein
MAEISKNQPHEHRWRRVRPIETRQCTICKILEYELSAFEGLQAEYLQWVATTFPDETTREQYVHLLEEIDEIGRTPLKAEEYADSLMLLLCVAHGNGVDILQAFREKFEINKGRNWIRTDRGYRRAL